MTATDAFLQSLVDSAMPVEPTFYGNRAENVEVTLLDWSENEIGPLTVDSLKLHFSIHDAIRGGGTLSLLNSDAIPGGWLNKKVRISYTFRSKTTVQGLSGRVVSSVLLPSPLLLPSPTLLPGSPDITVDETEIPEDTFTYTQTLGIFIPSSPSGARGPNGTPRTVELYDKLLILQQDIIETSYTVAAGTVITTKIEEIIQGAGGSNVMVDPSTETLSASMVFEAGTSKLQIVNALLGAVNYFSVWCDGDGWFRGSRYVAPKSRPVSEYILDEGDNSVYLENFTDNEDNFSIPNKFICVARVEGDQYSFTAVATNTDPSHPFSYQNRGNRWITTLETDVEASSPEALGKIAQRRLVNASSGTRKFEVSHALLPYALNGIVLFDNPTNSINGRYCVVEKMEYDLALPGAMMTSTLREVDWINNV